MSECEEIPAICQKAGARKPIGFDLTRRLENVWEPGEYRQAGKKFRPTVRRANGFQYEVVSAGYSGGKEPAWRNPETAGALYQDGSMQVRAEPISNDSLGNTIASSIWSGPAELTIDGDGVQSTGGEQKTFAFVSSDTRGKYLVENAIVFAENDETDTLQVYIEIE